jgi:hypothetical protein
MGRGPDGAAAVSVAIVPYSRVNEGINLQSVIDSIIWVEMALNLFMLEQASRRAWRLGKREEVRIYYLAYAGTAGHQKMRKLGEQSGAAAAFAGEPARGALIEEAGADRTTLARFSEAVEAELLVDDDDAPSLLTLLKGDDADELTDAFARRANEEREALQRGRTWFGAVDTLPERLPAFFREKQPDIWICSPTGTFVQVVEEAPANVPAKALVIDVEPITNSSLQDVSVLEAAQPLMEPDISGTDLVLAHQPSVKPIVFPPVPEVSVMVPTEVAPTAWMESGSEKGETVVPTVSETTETNPAPAPKRKRTRKLSLHTEAPASAPIPAPKDTPVPVSQLSVPTPPDEALPVSLTVASISSALIFGNTEHILLARQRRKSTKKNGGNKTAKKPRVQVQVHEIPALEPSTTVAITPDKTPARKVAKTMAPSRTLWDFADEQVAEHSERQQQDEQVLSQDDIDTLFHKAKTSPEAYEKFKQWHYTHAVPVTARVTVTYATWRMDHMGTWAIRYFVDDHSPVEKRYTGFHGEEDALELVRRAAPGLQLQCISFQQFSKELVKRAQNECMS